MAGELAQALAAFQAEAPRVAKDKTAKVPTKSGGQYSYSYADLADVAAAAYPLLAKHGLAFSCLPRPCERGYELGGLLLHSSGEQLEGALPLYGSTPQELGSAITYARRYLLGAMTGIVTDVDDDAGLAQHAPRQKDAPRQGWRPSEHESEGHGFGPPGEDPSEVPPSGGQRPATDRQLGALRGIAKRAQVTDNDGFHDWLTDKLGRLITHQAEVTMREASDLIERSKQ